MSKVNSYLNEIEAERLVSQGKYREALPYLEASLKSGEFIDRQTVYRNLSVCYMAFQKFEKARDILERIVSDGEEDADADALYNLAFCYYSLEDHPRAVKLFESIKQKEGLKKDTAYNLGMSYLAIGDADAAMENFRFLIGTDNSSTLVYNAGIALIGAEKPGLAADMFVQFLGEHPKDQDATFGLGMAYIRVGEDRKAIECLKRVISWDAKKYPSATVSLAMSYFRIGDLKNCVGHLDEALLLDPGMAEGWYYRGFVYESAGQPERAAEYYEKATDIDQMLSDAWLRLGQIRLKDSRLDEAGHCFKKVYRITHDTGIAYRIALVLIAQKKYGEAVEYLLIARESPVSEDFRPDELFENLSVCYYYLEDFALSMEYGEMTGLRDRSPFLLFILGSSSMKTGDLKKAMEYFAGGLEKSPDDINILYGLGILEGSRENYGLSEDYLKKALLIQRNLDIIYALALTEMKLGETAQAADLFEEYRKGHPGDADIQYKMGLIFIELKKPALARDAFRETLKIKPGNKKARDYLLSLNK
jgi:tetratricopeptide (TPR) repeat protein